MRQRAYERHDHANLVLLPVLGLLCVLGLVGAVDPHGVTTRAFAVYVAADLVWIALQPDAVPRAPGVILFHHAVTLALLSHPLRHPEHAAFTCWDGLVELNTAFLLARRQTTGWANVVFNALYWSTMWIVRGLLQPVLLYYFYDALRPEKYTLADRVLVLGSQCILCAFNVWLVYKNIAPKPPTPAAGSPAKAHAS